MSVFDQLFQKATTLYKRCSKLSKKKDHEGQINLPIPNSLFFLLLLIIIIISIKEPNKRSFHPIRNTPIIKLQISHPYLLLLAQNVKEYARSWQKLSKRIVNLNENVSTYLHTNKTHADYPYRTNVVRNHRVDCNLEAPPHSSTHKHLSNCSFFDGTEISVRINRIYHWW